MGDKLEVVTGQGIQLDAAALAVLHSQFEFTEKVPQIGDFVRYEKRKSGNQSNFKYPLIWPGAKPKGKDDNEKARYHRKCSVQTLRARHAAFFAAQ